MLTADQFKRLPEAFRRIVEVDRAMREPVVPLALARERRELRRFAQIIVHQPRSGGQTGRAG